MLCIMLGLWAVQVKMLYSRSHYPSLRIWSISTKQPEHNKKPCLSKAKGMITRVSAMTVKVGRNQWKSIYSEKVQGEGMTIILF